LSLAEPLAESAPLVRAWAGQHCDGCDWYHGGWQYLRLSGAISGLTAESEFFQPTIRRLARSGECRRVLIAASADYGMLAQVLGGFRAAGVTPEITILDRCRTPLLANDWYARLFDITPALHCADLFDFEAPARFDLICTHSFFSFVDPKRHVHLVEHWQRLLRPGGCVVTSQSVRPNYPVDRICFTPEQANEFGARAERLADGLDAPIREIATEFARHKTGHVVRSEAALRAAFDRGGLECVHFAPADAASQRTHRAANPDGRDSWRRIQVVARR